MGTLKLPPSGEIYLDARLDTATRLRATTGLKTPDAIHAATALTASCTLFVTNDNDFQRVTGLPVAVLHEIV